jgi:hypothetical protein
MAAAAAAMNSPPPSTMRAASIPPSGRSIATSAGFVAWEGEADEIGHLVHRPGGAWAFHYDIHGDDNADEAGYRFSTERFRPGEYVSIHEQDDEMSTFRIITVQEVA